MCCTGGAAQAAAAARTTGHAATAGYTGQAASGTVRMIARIRVRVPGL